MKPKMPNKGDRVKITSDYYGGALNGLATVLYVLPSEMLQVAVKLDKPCEDGHYYYRFTYKEVEVID